MEQRRRFLNKLINHRISCTRYQPHICKYYFGWFGSYQALSIDKYHYLCLHANTNIHFRWGIQMNPIGKVKDLKIELYTNQKNFYNTWNSYLNRYMNHQKAVYKYTWSLFFRNSLFSIYTKKDQNLLKYSPR